METRDKLLETHELLALDTLDASSGPADREALRVPGLTLLYHARLDRIGDVARLPHLRDGEPLNRLAPLFGPPGGGKGAPLADPGVSRDAARLVAVSGGVQLAVRDGVTLLADGEVVRGSMRFPLERLEEGVVLRLSAWSAALLHRVPLHPQSRPGLGLIGESEAIQAVRDAALRVAATDVGVLLRGESGTGKELVARAIHEHGPRRTGPFVAINMAAIPPSVAASELFGHVRGAFTGASGERRGHFREADGGTLFLDEIGEAPTEVQVALLRTLETGVVRPVGASRGVRTTVRVIAATDADLESAVAAGRFRQALLQRLGGFRLELPSLRSRRDDVGRLVVHFLRAELEALGAARRLPPVGDPRARPWLPASVVERLVRYEWPGNVRELRNVARQIAISDRTRERVQLDERLVATPDDRSNAAPTDRPGQPELRAPSRGPAEIGEDELVSTLRQHGWALGPTARALGIARSSLFALIDRSDRVRRPKDLSASVIEAAAQRCGGDLRRMSDDLEVSVRGLQLRMKELNAER